MQAGSEFFHTLKKILIKNNKTTLVGDEGGFAPNFESETQAFDLLMQAIEENKKINNYEFAIALDVAASEFYNKETKHYTIANKCYKTEELITWYKELAEQACKLFYPYGMNQSKHFQKKISVSMSGQCFAEHCPYLASPASVG